MSAFMQILQWKNISETKEDFEEAIIIDRQIRNARLPNQLFVHPARIPLEEVDFRTPEEKGQLSFWDDECSGICGI